MRVADYFYLSGIERRAAKEVYIKFRINRFELNSLVGLSAYLRLFNKRIVSKQIYCNWLGTGYRAEKKIGFYLYGLEKKGALHRLAYRRLDGQSLAISPYGVRILQAFEQALKEIEAQNQVKGPDYTELALNLNSLPDGYIIKHIGRN